MRVRKMDSNGDYVFGHGSLDFYVDEPAAVAQLVMTRLRLYKGEWMLDTSAGMDKDKILGTHTQSTRDAEYQRVIVETDGVNSILEYASSLNSKTRAFTVTARIDTIYGPATVSL